MAMDNLKIIENKLYKYTYLTNIITGQININ